ncbi:MAG: chromosome segregation SMC family protein, partial [Burkholderiaceae bacterium]
MRLIQIKLSGFKSFVDPTHFSLPGQLVGVVGPNGCGKSNIIDAARWVLGESKASELRGESMQDVIFNGSGQRKPAGRASVELIFDNASDASGKQGSGPWGQYADIAVKRVLTRDGTSTYLINNQVVRRRDIQDIFLGTGLGPRAYAIIGQGMITRIIEARPDELRVFLEEAAGVSKYKERRRETENRLADTRENLTRVEDILRELNANLDRLEQQAIVAQQYRDLQDEVDTKQKLLWMLRANEADGLAAKHKREGDEAQLALDARMADLRRVEAELERGRATHQDAGNAVHARQGEYYEAASAVSAIEAEIRVVVESRNRLQAQRAQLDAQHGHWTEQSARLDAAIVEAGQEHEAASAAIGAAEAALAADADQLPEAEAADRAWGGAVDGLRTQVVGAQKDLEIESTHQRNADRHLESIAGRKARLTEEKQRLDTPDPERLSAAMSGADAAAARLASQKSELAAAELSLTAAQTARTTAHEALTRESGESAQIDARLAAQKDLQQKVQANGKLQPWLDRHELGRLPKLWQRLHVEAGWETAVEAALRERIGALEIGQLDRARAFFGDLPPAKLAFYSE